MVIQVEVLIIVAIMKKKNVVNVYFIYLIYIYNTFNFSIVYPQSCYITDKNMQ